MNLHLPSCARFFARVEKHLYVFGPREEEAVGSVRLRRNLLSPPPLPLLGEKTISTSGDRYDHLFPTFALGLIKDFFLLSLLFSLFFFSHPKKLPGMIYGKEEFRFLLETRFLPPDPSNLPRCPRPRIIHREILSDFCPLYSTGETKRGEAKRFTIGLLAIARNVETFGKT